MSAYHIKHITRYTYPAPVIDSANQLMLFPIKDEEQVIKNHTIIISHQPQMETYTDYFGNEIGLFYLTQPHTELSIESVFSIVVHPVKPPVDDSPAEIQWEQLKTLWEQIPYMDFLSQESFDASAEVNSQVAAIKNDNKTPLAVTLLLSGFVYENFEYKKGITSVETKADEIWELKAGVCQDFAHILLVMLRIADIPARYVSGYICPKNHELRGEGATHAWVEAFIPAHGWIGIDPTNNCIVSDRHVRLAIGRNFSDCTPVKGIYKGTSEHTLEVSVTIVNGEAKKEDDTRSPTFTYQVINPVRPDNSYRKFIETQQQQQ